MSNTKTTLGFIAGISIGAIAGILLVPDSGAATRKKITDAATDLADTVVNSLSGLLNKAVDATDEVKDEATHLAAQGEQKIRQVMHHAKEGVA